MLKMVLSMEQPPQTIYLSGRTITSQQSDRFRASTCLNCHPFKACLIVKAVILITLLAAAGAVVLLSPGEGGKIAFGGILGFIATGCLLGIASKIYESCQHHNCRINCSLSRRELKVFPQWSNAV